MTRDEECYHYPKLLDDLIKEKETEYFKGAEFTGSNTETAIDLKVSLLDVTKN